MQPAAGGFGAYRNTGRSPHLPVRAVQHSIYRVWMDARAVTAGLPHAERIGRAEKNFGEAAMRSARAVVRSQCAVNETGTDPGCGLGALRSRGKQGTESIEAVEYSGFGVMRA